VLVLFILIFAKGNGIAQVDYCLPDCYNDAFGPLITINLPVQFSCGIKVVSVQYRIRIACPNGPGPYYDVYIQDIIWPANDPDFDYCVNLEGGLDKIINNKVTETLLRLNPMGFPPIENNPGWCVDNWRVMKGGCWKVIPNSNPRLMTACIPINDSNKVCCLERFKVCIAQDGSGERIISSQYFIPAVCPTELHDQGCIPVCGSIYGR